MGKLLWCGLGARCFEEVLMSVCGLCMGICLVVDEMNLEMNLDIWERGLFGAENWNNHE